MALIYVFVTSIILSFVPQQAVPYAKLDSAFDQANSSYIVSQAKEKVLMNILGTEGAYSKSQAELVLKDFFSKRPNGSFEFTFKGQESAAGTFAIGTYTSGGNKYRVTMHFKNCNSVYKIDSITIEKD